MVSNYTAEQREKILARSRDLLAQPPETYTPPPEPMLRRRYDPLPEPEPERRRERRRPPPMTPAAASQPEHWSQWEDWLAARLATEREQVLEAIVAIVGDALGNAIGDAIEHERDLAQRNLRELRAETSKLSSTVDELYGLLAAERSKIIDLPNPLPSRRVTN